MQWACSAALKERGDEVGAGVDSGALAAAPLFLSGLRSPLCSCQELDAFVSREGRTLVGDTRRLLGLLPTPVQLVGRCLRHCLVNLTMPV